MPGTSARLSEGDVFTVIDLLHGMLLPSGNDAATALAETFDPFCARYVEQAVRATHTRI